MSRVLGFRTQIQNPIMRIDNELKERHSEGLRIIRQQISNIERFKFSKIKVSILKGKKVYKQVLRSNGEKMI